jgi:hypothetical protein
MLLALDTNDSSKVVTCYYYYYCCVGSSLWWSIPLTSSMRTTYYCYCCCYCYCWWCCYCWDITEWLSVFYLFSGYWGILNSSSLLKAARSSSSRVLSPNMLILSSRWMLGIVEIVLCSRVLLVRVVAVTLMVLLQILWQFYLLRQTLQTDLFSLRNLSYLFFSLQL